MREEKRMSSVCIVFAIVRWKCNIDTAAWTIFLGEFSLNEITSTAAIAVAMASILHHIDFGSKTISTEQNWSLKIYILLREQYSRTVSVINYIVQLHGVDNSTSDISKCFNFFTSIKLRLVNLSHKVKCFHLQPMCCVQFNNQINEKEKSVKTHKHRQREGGRGRRRERERNGF